jgi:hypothetical protein
MTKIKKLETPPKKRLKIVEVDDFTKDNFKVNVGEKYDIEHEAQGEKRYGYLINTKNKKSIVMYASQVELL